MDWETAAVVAMLIGAGVGLGIWYGWSARRRHEEREWVKEIEAQVQEEAERKMLETHARNGIWL